LSFAILVRLENRYLSGRRSFYLLWCHWQIFKGDIHDAASESFVYRCRKFFLPHGAFFGPVDLGLHLAGKHNSLNIGTGLLAGSIFPGTSRLIFNGFSPAWGGFYISSMGGAGFQVQ